MATVLDNRKLKALVKETVKEVVSAEFIKLGAFLLPYISKEEQKDIERHYGKPSRRVATVYRLRV